MITLLNKSLYTQFVQIYIYLETSELLKNSKNPSLNLPFNATLPPSYTRKTSLEDLELNQPNPLPNRRRKNQPNLLTLHTRPCNLRNPIRHHTSIHRPLHIPPNYLLVLGPEPYIYSAPQSPDFYLRKTRFQHYSY